MTVEMVAVLAIALVTMICFIGGWFTVDFVAMLCLVALCVFGLIEPSKAIEGFSNPATITVLAMFILSEGVSRTGALNLVGQKILKLSKGNKTLSLLFLMLFVGVISMFINNTAAVALLIPVTLQISRTSGWSVSRLLMPLSFASMVGGVCTLIGTSTNLLASSILIESGYDGFTIFSFFKEGLIFFVIGIIYILLFYNKLIPDRRENIDEPKSYNLGSYLTYIRIHDGSPYVGLNMDSPDLDFNVINRMEGKDYYNNNIVSDDILFVEASLDSLKKLASSRQIEILPSIDYAKKEEDKKRRKIVEVIVSPDSKIVNQSVSNVHLFKRFGIKLMALRHSQKITTDQIEDISLKGGDTLLLAVPEEQIEELRASKMFIIVREPDLNLMKEDKTIITIAILAGVVILSALNIYPIYISALLGVCAMVLARVISFNEAYDAVNWRIIFLLAGLLALGHALESTGTTEFVSSQFLGLLEPFGVTAIIGGYFILTVIMTSFLSNNAAAVIMVPLAIHTANSSGISHINLVLTVMFAASLCFLTPIGYQTNMMVYGVAQYRFSDFIKFGGPLTLLMFIATLIVFGQ